MHSLCLFVDLALALLSASGSRAFTYGLIIRHPVNHQPPTSNISERFFFSLAEDSVVKFYENNTNLAPRNIHQSQKQGALNLPWR